MTYTEEQKKERRIDNINASNEAFKMIQKAIDLSRCGFVECGKCPYNLKEQDKNNVQCGYVVLHDLVNSMRGV